MSNSKGCFVLNDEPGFEASKGERIARALRRLWGKIHLLEQVRLSEKGEKLVKEFDKLDEEDITFTDVQYKLCLLQVQYVRSIVREKLNKDLGVSSKKKVAQKIQYDLASNYLKSASDEHKPFSYVMIDSKETQTGSSLLEAFVNDSPVPNKNQEINARILKESKAATHPTFPLGEFPTSSVPGKSKFIKIPGSSKLSSQSHYHLKLDDVPFILGASSSASHSVVANLQSIIAMMKTHHKALCCPKPRHQQTPGSMNREDTPDTNKMLQKLSHELSELTVKQERLKEMFDNAQKKESSHMHENTSGKASSNQNTMTASSNGLDSKYTLASASLKDIKELPKSKENIPRLIIPNVRVASAVAPLPACRKLLRSLQDFKSHLSEEDITWN